MRRILILTTLLAALVGAGSASAAAATKPQPTLESYCKKVRGTVSYDANFVNCTRSKPFSDRQFNAWLDICFGPLVNGVSAGSQSGSVNRVYCQVF